MNDSDASQILASRIAERLKALGLSERKASLDATGQPDAIRFIRTRGTMPSANRLMKLAKVLQSTTEYLTGSSDVNEWSKDQKYISLAATVSEDDERQFKSGRTVPVIGSVAYSNDGPLKKGELATDFAIYMFQQEVLAFAAPPLGVRVGRLGAFYPADTVMSPVFEPNVPVVFSHDEEAEIGDYALIFFTSGDVDPKKGPKFFALRRLVDRGEGWITVEQHNPFARKKMSTDIIFRILRVLSLRDYVAPPVDKKPQNED